MSNLSNLSSRLGYTTAADATSHTNIRASSSSDSFYRERGPLKLIPWFGRFGELKLASPLVVVGRRSGHRLPHPVHIPLFIGWPTANRHHFQVKGSYLEAHDLIQKLSAGAINIGDKC